MSRKATSVKGEIVDFDLLETKQKLEQNKPRVMEVKEREDFVHRRRKTRGRRSAINKIKENKTELHADKLDDAKQKKSPKNEKSSTSEKQKRTIVKKGTSNTKKDDG